MFKAIHILSEWADFRLTRFHVRAGVGAIALSLLGVLAFQIGLSKDFITPAGTPVGGDYVAFWAAAKAMAAGNGALAYDPVWFNDWLGQIGPPHDGYALTWQYPPTYFFAISLLAFLPFGAGYAVWTGGAVAIFAATCRSLGVKGAALLIILASPVAFQAAITGQNGFLTASLLAGAALLPDKRPIIAGLCAAALTMKPQLGVLIPIAYIAGGCWRAFGVAAAGSIALAGASLILFGPEIWAAFFDSLAGASAAVGSGVMPLYKMPSVYGAFALAGAPPWTALAMQALGALAAIVATIAVWRRHSDPALRAAVVCAGVFFISPYVFYYELIIFAAPLALLAMAQRAQGWRPHDHLLLTALFLAPMALPGEPRQFGFNLGFTVVVLAAVFVTRHFKAQEIGAFARAKPIAA